MTTIPTDLAAAPPSPADPIAAALLAVIASVEGDAAAAERHLLAAREQSRSAVRRQRQILEIAKLVVEGTSERADGLALVHIAEFPYDTELLDRMTGHSTAGGYR